MDPRVFIPLVLLAAVFAKTQASLAQTATADNKSVHVSAYIRQNGTHVADYNRAAPGTSAAMPRLQATSSATYNTAKASPPAKPEREQTQIIAIYHGRGWFDAGLAEQLQPILATKFEIAKGEKQATLFGQQEPSLNMLPEKTATKNNR